MILENLSGEILVPMSLIFARVGAAFQMFPAIGSKYILTNARLAIALLVSIILFPILKDFIPKGPMTSGEFALLLGFEFMYGMVISIGAKICFAALDIVGSIISMQSGLAAANFFDPNQGEQVSIVSNFLVMTGYMMIFATDTHYMLFESIVESYKVFQVGSFINTGDLSNFIANTVNQSFILGFKLAAPFIAVSIGFLISNGVLSRLMPNLQVFFVVTPVQIFVMFIILFITINHIMAKFIEALQGAIHFQGLGV
jgi:flagellar biosynthesis protein FliR